MVDKITDANGAVVQNIEPRVLKQTVSEATSEKIRQYCRAVVMPEGGTQRTGKTARPAGYAIGGKTGTAENPAAIGLLPQPFVTVACSQNEVLSVVMDMNEQWSLLQGENGSRMVTGVTVVRNAFLEENEKAVKHFLQEHQESTDAINSNVEKGAELVANAGIIAKAPIAQKAIPKCNITYIDGAEMKQALSGYLQVLFEQNAASVGGKLPEEGFYYIQ